MRFRNFAAVVAIAMIASTVVAAEPETPPAPGQHPAVDAVRIACADDIKLLCSNLEPGGGRIVRCLRDNEEKLSPQCKDARAAARSSIERKAVPQ